MSAGSCLVVGVTGRSGCGKSTVCDAMRKAGHTVLDGDRVARRITAPGSPVLARLAEAFGADILDESGALRRRLLADRAFATAEGTRTLTDITHPAIIHTLLDGVEQAAAAGRLLCFVDGAAIVGQPFQPYCDRIVVVTAPREDSVARICARDGISRQAACRRLDAQTPEAVLRDAADYIIENSGSLEHLHRQVQRVLDALQKESHEQGHTTA